MITAVIDHVSGDDLHQQIQEAKDTLYKESYKLKRHNSHRRKLLQHQAQIELILDSIQDSLEPYRYGVVDVETPKALPSLNNLGEILTLSDAHYGRVGINIQEKLDHLLSRLYDLQPRNLHILVLGDMIDGLLRTSQFQFIEKLPLDQCFEFADIFERFLLKLAKLIPPFTVHYVTQSNHSEIRPLGSSRLDFKTEDYERIIARDLVKTCPNIPIHVYEDGIIDFSLGKFNILGIHGHQFKGKAGTIQHLSYQRDKVYDYMFYGHYHHEKIETIAEGETHNKKTIGVPALADTDEYAMTLGSSSLAEVHLHEITSEGLSVTRRFLL